MVVCSPSVPAFKAAARGAIYLVDSKSNLKLFVMQGNKVVEKSSMQLSGYHILSLVRYKDQLLLQNNKDKSKFIMYSPFEGQIASEFSLFSEVFQKTSQCSIFVTPVRLADFRGVTVSNCYNFDHDRGLALKNEQGDVVLLKLHDCKVFRVVNDFWHGRRSYFKRLVVNNSGNLLIGGFLRNHEFYFMGYDFRSNEERPGKMVELRQLIAASESGDERDKRVEVIDMEMVHWEGGFDGVILLYSN